MEENRRRRPLRILICLVAVVSGAVCLAVAQALPGNSYDIPTVDDGARTPLLGCAGILLLVGLWALATGKNGRRRDNAAGRDAERADPPDLLAMLEPAAAPTPDELPAPTLDQSPAPRHLSAHRGDAPPAAPAVLRRLRGKGWYVADDVELSRTTIDHVAVGPAGVLAVQVTSTDAADASGLALGRARVAAEQFQRLLLDKELDIEVVPAMLVWGPNLGPMAGGVLVVDSVAVLSGRQADEWLAELAGKELLDSARVRAVRDVLADIVLGGISDSEVTETARA